MRYQMYKHERELWRMGYERIAGIDEAGRGPLAGPVVAAAVILSRRGRRIAGITDSKQLSLRERQWLFGKIMARSRVGVGMVSPAGIDRINILEASREAMQLAIGRLLVEPDFLLIDGRVRLETKLPKREIIRGDCTSASVAAASIIAKVIRDWIMIYYDHRYPSYEFALHKGYPTRRHRGCLALLGPCPIHRMTFANVKSPLSTVDSPPSTEVPSPLVPLPFGEREIAPVYPLSPREREIG